MAATCHAKIDCMEKAVVTVKLNDKGARAILCCENCFKGLEALCEQTGSIIVEKRDIK